MDLPGAAAETGSHLNLARWGVFNMCVCEKNAVSARWGAKIARILHVAPPCSIRCTRLRRRRDPKFGAFLAWLV